MPKVSVIIPVYNCDRYITQTVESVLSQTYTNYEIIVVDDGSTDNTRQVLEPYFARIQYIYQPNKGVAAARNQGIELAKGELIAFLDHDDVFLPDKLAEQVSHFQNNSQVGMLHSGWYRINHEGKILGKVEPWHQALELDLQNWLAGKPVLLSAMMFRRDWLIEAEGLDTGFEQVCDLDLVLRLSLMGCETGWLRKITLCYREHDRNESLKTPVQAKEFEKVLDKFFSLPNVPRKMLELEKQCRYYSLVWSAWRLYHTGYLAEMANYLEKSLVYPNQLPTATIINWIERFKNYASQNGYRIDTYSLINSPEWKKLIQKCIYL